MYLGEFQSYMDALKQFCIQLVDAVFKRKYRNIEHRRFIRLSNSIVAGIRLVDCKNGIPYSKQIKGSTINISKEGLCVESCTATVDGVDIFNDAMSPEKCLEIELDMPDSSEKIKTCGKVVWLDMTPKDKSFLFKAGIHLDLQNCSDKEVWNAFVDRAKRHRRSQSWLMTKTKCVFK